MSEPAGMPLNYAQHDRNEEAKHNGYRSRKGRIPWKRETLNGIAEFVDKTHVSDSVFN